MAQSYRKVQNVGKRVVTPGPGLDKVVLKTMDTISQIVGATLGPGGRSVLIERQDYGMAPFITKDGVSVHRSLGFEDSVQQIILEAARDAATKTAEIAGDGTTSSTILSSAIVHNMSTFLKNNPKTSPQKVIREISNLFKNTIKPLIDSLAIKAEFGTEEGNKFLRAVACISGNGDEELADSVMKSFDLVGDAGEVTITEISGPTGYVVEAIEGYPIPSGYEESCARFFSMFLNDKANQRIFLEDPVFVLYFGSIVDTTSLLQLTTKIHEAWQSKENYSHNVIIFANGFSEDVLGTLAATFVQPELLNVVPVVIPKSPILNGSKHLLEDLAAFTGGTVLDPITAPLHRATLEDLGRPMVSFESYRYRSVIVGDPDEVLISERVDELRSQLKSAESQLEASILNERIGKISGGIAKIKVSGSSNGELRERRDRVEDSVLSVRAAMREGFLPGGGWALAKIYVELEKHLTPVVEHVLLPSLLSPIKKLLSNSGLSVEEIEEQIVALKASIIKDGTKVYDASKGVVVDALHLDSLILDSVPAVSEAIRNSISIASLLGSLGGVVAFARDNELERSESQETSNFLRQSQQDVPQYGD